MTYMRARVTRVTRVMRDVTERHLHRQRHTARARASEHRRRSSARVPVVRGGDGKR